MAFSSAAGPQFASLRSQSPDLGAVAVRVKRGTETVAHTDHPAALTGGLTSVVAHAARYVAAFGQYVSAGRRIITGTVVPAGRGRLGDRFRGEASSLGAIDVAITA